jgi:hypothetical protein
MFSVSPDVGSHECEEDPRLANGPKVSPNKIDRRRRASHIVVDSSPATFPVVIAWGIEASDAHPSRTLVDRIDRGH